MKKHLRCSRVAKAKPSFLGRLSNKNKSWLRAFQKEEEEEVSFEWEFGKETLHTDQRLEICQKSNTGNRSPELFIKPLNQLEIKAKRTKNQEKYHLERSGTG